MKRLLHLSLLLAGCFLFQSSTRIAKGDSFAPCSPNCTFTDPYSLFTISTPSTALTLWSGTVEDVPDATYHFGVLATPDTTHTDLVDVVSAAYALSDSDMTGSVRFAQNKALGFWLNYENLQPGWTEDGNGLISFTDPPDPPATISENPEPATWLLMITGITMLFLPKLIKSRATS